MNPKYLIVSPVRDEAEYIRGTVESVLAQNILPAEWILVNDGSKDDTESILREYILKFPWMRLVNLSDRGFRKAGGGVMQAFYAGFNARTVEDWDFVVKLDADVTFAPDYFASCLKHFSEDPRLGIAGGQRFNIIAQKPVIEKTPHFHVNGSTKIYRRACWESIGGLRVTVGWDTIDEVMANMHGWSTTTFSEIVLNHHRFTGDADGAWRSNVKYGRIGYLCGYHPCYMLARCIYRSFSKPYGLRSAAMAYGYLHDALQRRPRPVDQEFVRFVHTQQWRRLTGAESIWR